MKATLGIATMLAASSCLLGAPRVFAATIVAWGNNSDGQTNIPPSATNIVAIAGGSYHSVALRNDGTVVAWGRNYEGQTNVPVGLADVLAIEAGAYHSLALKSDRTIVAWGKYYNGTTWVTMTAPSGLTNVASVAGGGNHALALKTDGTVVAWGWNSSGQTNVPPTATNIVAISAGDAHNLALRGDGSVVAWGNNYHGESSVPTDVTNIVAVAAGYFHSLALKSDGTVLAWGSNYDGRIDIPPTASNVVAIAGGEYLSLALRADGTAVAWGTPELSIIPTGVTNIADVQVGSGHALALVAKGPVIWPQPASIMLFPQGVAATLSFSVKTPMNFTCQWLFNGLPLVGSTSTNLPIGPFEFAKAGIYSVEISNVFGITTVKIAAHLTNSPVVLVDGDDVGGGSVARVDSTQITMTNTGSGATIYFTLDGSAPDFTDIPYTGPFTLTNSATIRAIAYNAAFTDSAEAAPINLQISPTYPLTASTPGGGSIGVSPAAYSGGNRYVSNTVVTLTATPSNGWSFLHWTGDSTATTNVTTVLMDRSRTVEAVFGTSLNLFTNGNGQLVLNPAGGPYAFGSTVQLTALPAPGAYFFGWAGAAGGFNNPLYITATNGAGITALFGALTGNQVSLVVLPNGNGTVSVNPSKNVYTNGETVTLTAVPAANQTFTGWSGDASGNLNPLVLALTTSKLITANFAPGLPTNPPVITQPPLSRTLSAGANTLLSFALTGDGPFSYQWRFSGSPLSGATNPTLSLNGVTAAQAGLYNIVVTGPGGAVTSTPASVAIFGMQFIPSGGQPLPLLILDGAIGTQYRLETASNIFLPNWSLLTSVTLPSARFYFADTASSNQTVRLYRAVPQ